MVSHSTLNDGGLFTEIILLKEMFEINMLPPEANSIKTEVRL